MVVRIRDIYRAVAIRNTRRFIEVRIESISIGSSLIPVTCRCSNSKRLQIHSFDLVVVRIGDVDLTRCPRHVLRMLQHRVFPDAVPVAEREQPRTGQRYNPSTRADLGDPNRARFRIREEEVVAIERQTIRLGK